MVRISIVNPNARTKKAPVLTEAFGISGADTTSRTRDLLITSQFLTLYLYINRHTQTLGLP